MQTGSLSNRRYRSISSLHRHIDNQQLTIFYNFEVDIGGVLNSDAIASLKSLIEGEDTGAIKAKMETLTQSSMKLGEAMYKAAQEEAAAEGGDGGDRQAAAGAGDAGDAGEATDAASGGEDNVVDADFEEVRDEDKKDQSA